MKGSDDAGKGAYSLEAIEASIPLLEYLAHHSELLVHLSEDQRVSFKGRRTALPSGSGRN